MATYQNNASSKVAASNDLSVILVNDTRPTIEAKTDGDDDTTDYNEFVVALDVFAFSDKSHADCVHNFKE